MRREHDCLKLFFLVSIFFIAAFATVFADNVEKADQINNAVPVDNGTTSQVNVTGRMQQYVGFYGTVAMEVRKTTAAGNVMYNKTVTTGKLYFFKSGATPTLPFFAAPVSNVTNDGSTNGNFSLSGYYVTGQHFDTQAYVCNTTNVWKLNTTDGYATGVFNDSSSPSNYFFCVDIKSKVSTNGYGVVQYEIIVAKTSSYQSYDIWFDLT